MGQVDIRAFAEDDVEDFQHLRLNALQEYPDAFGLSSETVAARLCLAAESLDDFTLGAYRDGELVGMVGFYRDSGGEKMRHKGHVWGMYVASKRQGQGVGKALMRELLVRAALLPGLEQVHLAVVTRQEPRGACTPRSASRPMAWSPTRSSSTESASTRRTWSTSWNAAALPNRCSRTLSSHVSAFLNAGFTIEGLHEPTPSEEQLTEHPEFSDEFRVPNFIMYVLKKPTG